MPKPFSAEFRRDVVAVARKYEAPIAQISRDFGISQATLHSWLKKTDIEDGNRLGGTEAESSELRDLSADVFPVTVACRVPGFSTQAFYAWKAAPVTGLVRHLINAALDIHRGDPAFGYRFIADELKD